MAEPEVSVVMPTFNTIDYIDEAVLSILSQQHQSWELICFDDHSDDGTYERLKFWEGIDPRITVERPFGDHGSYIDILNMLIEESRGKYIARMDSDDVSLPDRLHEQFGFMEKKRGVALLGAMALNIIQVEHRIVDDYPWEADIIRPVASREIPVNEAIRTHHRIIHGTIFALTDILKELGGYDDLWPIEDWDLSLRASEYGDVYVLPEVLYLRRIHPHNHSKGDPNKDRAFAVINNRHDLGLKERPRSRPENL